ncbi:MAG: AmmeMemoRadiSam system protein B [Endomicrobiia bacterium]
MNRKLQFSGSWYPDNKEEITKYLISIPEENKVSVTSCICPHAGWMYSGKVAGEVYSKIKPADVYILLGPNHTGMGKNIAVYPEGYWEGPLGKIKVNSKIVELLVKSSEFLEKDFVAHYREHSLEVQIPFLQVISKKDFTIVPITIRAESYQICEDIGRNIALVVKKYKKDFPDQKVVLISSTDMSHYEEYEYAKKLDFLAIEQILNLYDKGLYDTVLSYGISMCGVIPTVCTIIASKLLGAKTAQLVKYQTSGDVSGDYEQVVGYAGLVIY